MDQKTQELINFYGKDHKDDFYSSYMYMKYIYHYILKSFKKFGAPLNATLEEIDPTIDEILQSNANTIAEGFGSTETSLYHGKVVNLQDAKKIASLKMDLQLDVPETIVPFKMAKNVLFKNPESIAIGTCPCRMAQEKCDCMPAPMEACMFIGDPHASFIAEHNPRFRKISQEEAIHMLEDFHNKGFVHCAYFRKDMGNRLYAICNCCSCCCGGMKAHNLFSMGVIDFSSMAPSGYVAKIEEGCIGCEGCVSMCRFNAISMDYDQNLAVVDFDKCMGCGVCESVCPTESITLKAAPSKGGILDMDELSALM